MTYEELAQEFREVAGHLLSDRQIAQLLAAANEYAAHEADALARTPRFQMSEQRRAETA